MTEGPHVTDIGETLQQREILLFGGNGFLGKTLLALILDRYPQFKHLHILVRPRRDLPARDRFFNETLASPALASVAAKRGGAFLREKISVCSGDVSQPYCGIKPAALEQLVGRVHLVINCAGRVDFFPPVDESFSSNVDGVENVVALAKRLRAKLVHVSTGYVCGEADGLVEETEPILGFYPRRKGPGDDRFHHAEEIRYCRERIRQVYDSSGPNSNAGNSQRSREIAERLIALGKQRAVHWGWVNTYTYAKSLGEQIVAAEADLDYAIVRPAIVESALRFPFPGWIEGGRTSAPLVLMALGGLKHWPLRKDIPLEIVPVDLVASAILVVGALLLNGRHARVYQLGTADVNPIFLEPLVALLDAESRKRRKNHGPAWLGLLDSRGNVRFVSAEQAQARRVSLQKKIRRAESVIAGLRRMLDTTRLPGNQSLARWTTALRALELQAAFREQTVDQYLPFIRHNRYIFESENIRRGYTLISEKDRELLPWDPERIDWKDYWINHQIKGIETWVQPEAVKEWTFRI